MQRTFTGLLLPESVGRTHKWMNNVAFILAWFAFLGLMFIGSGLYAQPYVLGTETLVNTSTANTQQFPAIAMDSLGNTVLVWESWDTDNSRFGIYAQRFDATGTAVGSETKVNTTTSNNQSTPDVAMDPSGNYVITWMSQDQDGDGWGIYAQRFSSNGTANGSEFLVNNTTTGNQKHPRVAIDATGDFVITWTDEALDGSNLGIFAQRFDASGTPQGLESQVNTTTSEYQGHPAIAMSPSGAFTIVWQSLNQDSSNHGVYGQRFDAAGSPQGTEFQIHSDTLDNQQAPAIDMDANGNFVVVWSSYGTDGDGFGVYGQRFDATGAPLGNEFPVNTTTTGGQDHADIALADNGEFLVTWSSYGQDSSYYGVYSQQFDASGNPVGGETQLNTRTDDFQQAARAAWYKAELTLFVTWMDGMDNSSTTQDGDDYGISMQTFLMNPSVTAVCKNMTVHLNQSGQGSINTTDLDNGSSSNGLAFTLNDEQIDFDCSQTGANPVNLIVTLTVDSTIADTCTATVTVLDTVTPSIVCPANITVGNDAASCDAVVTFSVTTSDNCTGEVLSQTAGLPSGSTFPLGTSQNNFTVTDASGNTSSCSFTVTVEDQEAPAITCPADLTVNNEAGTCAATVTFTVSTSDNCTGESLTQVLGLASGSSYPLGATQNIFSVTDGANNTANCTFTVTVVDNEAPVITCPSDIAAIADPANCEAIVTFSVSSSDNCTGATVNQTAGLPSGSSFPTGITTNTFQITDAASNLDSCTFTVTVTDTNPPIVTCPSDTTVINEEEICGAFFVYNLDISGDCNGETLTQTSGLSSGYLFPIGTTTNSFQIQDGAGNSSNCTFTVTVIDFDAPYMSCSNDKVAYTGNANCEAVVTYSTSTSDNCSGSWKSQIAGLSSGSNFPIGITTNSFVAYDVSGNTDTCVFTVTVLDTITPTLTCPANMVVNNAWDACDGIAYYTINSSDNCTGATLTQTAGIASGTTFPLGITTNSFSITDASGNTNSCSFTVTIEDTQAPNVTCPGSVTTYTGANSCDAAVSYLVFATDNCTGETLTQTAGLSSGSAFPIGTTTNSFTLTDAAGNTANCSFDVLVLDSISPSISCPADTSIESWSEMCGALHFYSVSSSDNCTGEVLTQLSGTASANFIPVGVTTNVFSVSDAAGNTTTCTFQVTVIDIEAPYMSCPSNKIAYAGTNECDAVVTFSTSKSDNCSGSWKTQTGGLPSGSNFPIGITTNTFQAEDAAGNTDTCSFTITVFDTITPGITCPANVTEYVANGACDAVANYTISSTDNCPGQTVTQSAGLATGSTFPLGSTVNTFTVSDASGNAATCSFTVTVVDTLTPTITCPAAISVNNDPGSCDAVVTYSASTSDNCSGETVTLATGLASGSAFPIGTTANTLTVTDGSGNAASCSFTVTVIDNESPMITCPTDFNIDNEDEICGYFLAYSVTSSDNCTGETVTQVSGLNSGALFPIGTTTNEFSVSDASGNTASCIFTVTVQDAEAPNLSCPGDRVLYTGTNSCDAVGTFSASSNDNCSGSSHSLTGGLPSGSSFPIGVTTNTYTAVDAAGNTTTCTFTVTVIDAIDPAITCPANQTVYSAAGSCTAIATYAASTSDNCTGETVSLTAGLASGSTFPIGITTNDLTVTDASGNTASCSFTVTVLDTIAPTVTCPANLTVNNDPGSCDAVITFAATGADNCSGVSITLTSGLASGSSFPLGTTTNIMTATDASGNTATCLFTLTVEDNEAPSITCPADMTVNNEDEVCGAFPTFSVSATDNCIVSNVTQTQGSASGALFNIGTTTNEFTASDVSGNTATCSFTVTVLDAELPNLYCPQDKVLYTGTNSCDAVTTFSASSNDNCSGVSHSLTSGLASGSSFPIGVTTNTYTAVDAAGNTQNCSFTVTVIDNIDPTITCPANLSVNSDAGSCDAVVTFTVNSSDNCTGETVTLTSGLASGSAFPQGVTSNAFTVTDGSGNTADCNFTVTVTDNEAPAISCPANMTVSTDANACSATVSYSTPGVTDNCTPNFRANLQAYGGHLYEHVDNNLNYANASAAANNAGGYLASISSAGENSFVRGLNTAGNNLWIGFNDVANEGTWVWESGEAVTYTNWRTNEPNNSNNEDGLQLRGDGLWNDNKTWRTYRYVVEYAANMGTVDVTSGQGSGGSFATGVHTETWTATDEAGNTSSCSFTITVEDQVAPTVTCPANIILIADPGSCTSQANYGDATAIDNCTASFTSGSVYYGGHSYNFLPTVSSWTNARNGAVAQGGYLSAIGSQGENDFLNALAGGGRLWIGLSDHASENNYVWVNGETVSYTNWNPGEPNRSAWNADYIEMYSSGKWNDRKNSANRGYVTEFDTPIAGVGRISGSPSGATLPVGVHTVTYQANDDANNISTCSFTITVLENGCGSTTPQTSNGSQGQFENEEGVDNSTPAAEEEEEAVDALATFTEPELGMEITAYPNPFDVSTNLRFRLMESAEVTVEIYALTGVRVATVYEGKAEAGIEQEVTFLPENLTSGVYFYRLTTSTGEAMTGKLMYKQ